MPELEVHTGAWRVEQVHAVPSVLRAAGACLGVEANPGDERLASGAIPPLEVQVGTVRAQGVAQLLARVLKLLRDYTPD
jgi:hypothetical protein